MKRYNYKTILYATNDDSGGLLKADDIEPVLRESLACLLISERELRDKNKYPVTRKRLLEIIRSLEIILELRHDNGD